MPQKNKKNKKKDIPKRKGNDFSKNEKFKPVEIKPIKLSINVSSHFKNEELQEIKNVLKIKDVNNVPMVIASVVLNKIEILKQLISEGCNVNELGPNHTTPLMWAVKLKNMEIVDVLLANGADSTAKNDNGYNALFLALENKIWDEKSFIKLWNHIKHTAFIDVDFMGKDGRNVLHTTIRREWVNVLKILIVEKVNVNATNSNKVTPLMLASYLNNFNMVNELLQANADILREDSGGSTALCYAIATVVNKNIETPHLVINKLLSTLETVGVTFETFLQTHIDAILSCPVKQKKSGQAVLDAKDYIIPYALQHKYGSLNILLEEKTFEKITQAMVKYIDDPQHLAKYLTIVNNILHSHEFTFDSIRKRVLDSFISDGCANACLTISKKYGFDTTDNFDFSLVFEILVLNSISHPNGKVWLTDNYDDMLLIHSKFLAKNVSNNEKVNHNKEEYQKFVDLIRMIKLDKTIVNNCPLVSKVLESNDNKTNKENKPDLKITTKRTKRRSKALKAKIAKIKSADLTERLNPNGNKILEQKCASDTSIIKRINPNKKVEEKDDKTREKHLQWPRYSTWEQVWLMDSGNDPIMKEYNDTMVILEHKITEDLNNGLLDEATEPNLDSFVKEFKDKIEYDQSSTAKDTNSKVTEFPDGCNLENPKGKSSYQDLTHMLQSTISYLSILLNRILENYQNNWSQDSETNNSKSNILEKSQMSHIHNIVRKLEVEHLQRVQNEFDALIVDINNTAHEDIVQCTKVLERLEHIFINHKIRGKSIIDDIPAETLKNNSYFSGSYFKESEGIEPDELMYKTKTPSNQSYVSSHIPKNHPDALYLQEVLSLSAVKPINLSQLMTAQENTMKYAYHLWSSIDALCDDSDNNVKSDQEETEGDESVPEESISINKKRLSFQENLLAVQNRPSTSKDKDLLDVKSDDNTDEDNFGQFPSRWYNIVKSLQAGSNYHVLLNGDVRISSRDKDLHVISSGGNFSTVVLGLDSNDQPLAVKRIKAHSDVSKLMKDLINPLLGLRNANLLHYFTCNFENNELVVATPLCEYNMGEYVMFMKQHSNMLVRSFDVVKQFLSGLRFLHNRNEPIIHGNLKPSNIFLDLNGTVRIAEFGMHKALYTLVEAPNTSVIWFARETFNKFKETACITCTCASDIQVAGMLIHFILTAGKHPYGENMQEILKNLERAMPQLITNNIDLHDLISWMLLYDPTERPTINQVLSHVFFWQPDRKWRFILACAGLSAYGTPLDIPVKELFLYINLIAIRENIKGKWISITKKRFPHFKYSEGEEDSIAGLLAFIRFCVQNEMVYCIHGHHELRNYILQTFPALPLSLYRILESSQWLTHYVLQPFTTVDSVSA